eukprot:sb/3478020/
MYFFLKRFLKNESKEGYAQAYGDTGYTQTRCTDAGWNPGFDKLMKCVQGCKDISGDLKSGNTDQWPSTTTGTPPYGAGDVIECKIPYSRFLRNALGRNFFIRNF